MKGSWLPVLTLAVIGLAAAGCSYTPENDITRNVTVSEEEHEAAPAGAESKHEEHAEEIAPKVGSGLGMAADPVGRARDREIEHNAEVAQTAG